MSGSNSVQSSILGATAMKRLYAAAAAAALGIYLDLTHSIVQFVTRTNSRKRVRIGQNSR